jgi:hypothetical protein
MLVIRVPRKYDPGCVEVNIPVQVELVLEVSNVHTMHPDDVPNAEYMWQIFSVLGE